MAYKRKSTWTTPRASKRVRTTYRSRRTYRRRPNYRSRRSTRTGYRRRGLLARRGMGEVKTFNPTINAFSIRPDLDPNEALEIETPPFNRTLNGSQNNQRIGNIIGPCSMQFRYAIDYLQQDREEIPEPIQYAAFCRVIVIQMKGQRNLLAQTTADLAIPTIYQLLYVDMSTLSNAAHIAPFREGVTTFCRILYDTTHRFDFDASTGSVVRKLRMNISNLRWFAESGDTICTNPVLIYFVASSSAVVDSNLYPGTMAITQLTSLRFYDC